MRNLWDAIVNWVAALFAAGTGAPHPMIATDDPFEPDDRER
ncbi:hypothetical protein SAMN04487783_0839 [Agrococcus baldri]|uniref:Uncharacterized protein n=1 Tax=Agrococcus baldri TaxID=153730 RepID=A0AA94HLC4_9MICO|nr:hypothetical protein [Agrococcus baldri]SFS06516.1 hypothetical protein SAMN04487783_0839 [Agrococcus baldri]